MKSILKITATLLMLTLVLICGTTALHFNTHSKQYEVKSYNDKEIIYKTYDQKLHLNENLKSLYSTYTPKFYKTKQNKILIEGYIIDANYDSIEGNYKVIIKTITLKKYNNKITKITKKQNIAHYFNLQQINDIKNNHINDYLIIKEVYYPNKHTVHSFYKTKPNKIIPN